MGTNFAAWVSRILKNVFLSSVCRSKWAPTHIDDLPESFCSIPAEQEDVVFGEQIKRAVDNLCPGQRQVIKLVCVDGLSYDEAAIATNSTLSTIKSRLWRARKHMERLRAESIYTDSTATRVSAAR
jgi:RNA polymerase sigma-70 factor (ECF subfamily)